VKRIPGGRVATLPPGVLTSFRSTKVDARQYRLRVAELQAIGITTANQAASLRFYGLIGVEVPDPGEDHVEAPVPGGLHLMWDTEELIRQIEPDLPTPVRQRIVLAFRCADPTDVDATYARVVDAGFEGKAEPWDAFWGQRFAYLRDPDGNTVALFAPLG
jgi:catechol 2,3-dioxygenase-like lactoylglutathione lyase family enzyme